MLCACNLISVFRRQLSAMSMSHPIRYVLFARNPQLLSEEKNRQHKREFGPPWCDSTSLVYIRLIYFINVVKSMFFAQSVWAREDDDEEVGRKKSEFEVWNPENINQPYILYLRPYALRLMPCALRPMP